jgi:hypothetical protein
MKRRFKMKRPLAYITAAWSDNEYENIERAAKYCRAVYEAGFSPICPLLTLTLFLNDEIPEEHKSGIDISRDLLRRSHVLVLCGEFVDEDVKNDIAVAGRLNITATTLDGILAVKTQGRINTDD